MRYRVHRIKAAAFENFRWAAHTGGLAILKPKDYEAGIEVDGPSPYAVWKQLAGDEAPLRPGDVLEALEPQTGPALQVAKYIGFEPAQWYVPEPKQDNLVRTDETVQTPNEAAISGNV